MSQKNGLGLNKPQKPPNCLKKAKRNIYLEEIDLQNQKEMK